MTLLLLAPNKTLQQRTVKSYKNFRLPITNNKNNRIFSTKISYNFFLTIIGNLKCLYDFIVCLCSVSFGDRGK
jgi:hypothetical protein